MDEWVNKMQSGHTTEYYSAINRNEVVIQVMRMNLENIML